MSAFLATLLTGCSDNDRFKLKQIDPYIKEVLKHCRNNHTHTDARELVPLSEIIEENIEILDDVSRYQDNLLPLIVDWYRTKFFKWFEPPECSKCNSKLDNAEIYINSETKRVEVYKCHNDLCDNKFEFIRHNDPAILLHTRTGRCGEWAICFLILLRSLDYDTRIVYDITDHVWNEVWSEPKQRWVHVDPCEGIVDCPLLYEAGWKKELVYCLAFSQYEALDVTARYVCTYTSTLGRRRLCDEHWLREHLDGITEELLHGAPSDEIRNRVRSRRAVDKRHLEKLAITPQVVPTNLHGRRTGGIQWRLERGEYSLSSKTSMIIRATSGDRPSDEPLFEFMYSCDKDSYECSDQQYNSKGWASLVYEYENIDHKYESDWKTSYLSRYETCSATVDGKVTWKFDLSGLKGQWQVLELLVGGKVYPHTRIELQVCTFDCSESESLIDTIHVPLNQTLVMKRDDQHVGAIAVMANLRGGQEADEVAWQKPQLFRQRRGQDARACCLSLKVL